MEILFLALVAEEQLLIAKLGCNEVIGQDNVADQCWFCIIGMRLRPHLKYCGAYFDFGQVGKALV